MKIGYSRVSSVGQNLDAQIDMLKEVGVEKVFSDKASGTSRDGRPELAQAIDFAREGDALIVTRLDRLARSMMDLLTITTELERKGVDLIVTEQQIDTTTSVGRLMFRMIGSFAEFENDLRRERQAEGIAKAKAKGVYKGRKASIDREAVVAALEETGHRPAAAARKLGIARSSVYRIADEIKEAQAGHMSVNKKAGTEKPFSAKTVQSMVKGVGR